MRELNSQVRICDSRHEFSPEILKGFLDKTLVRPENSPEIAILAISGQDFAF